jgi:hypothetical protein
MRMTLLFLFCVLCLRWYLKDKGQKREIERIRSLNNDRRGIELVKLQGRLSDYKTNHVLHLLLTLLMFGFWIIPWILISRSNSSKRAQIKELIQVL